MHLCLELTSSVAAASLGKLTFNDFDTINQSINGRTLKNRVGLFFQLGMRLRKGSIACSAACSFFAL